MQTITALLESRAAVTELRLKEVRARGSFNDLELVRWSAIKGALGPYNNTNLGSTKTTSNFFGESRLEPAKNSRI